MRRSCSFLLQGHHRPGNLDLQAASCLVTEWTPKPLKTSFFWRILLPVHWCTQEVAGIFHALDSSHCDEALTLLAAASHRPR